jgi:hypothetical protein
MLAKRLGSRRTTLMSAEISKVKKIIWIKDTTEVTPTIITLIQFMAGHLQKYFAPTNE